MTKPHPSSPQDTSTQPQHVRLFGDDRALCLNKDTLDQLIRQRAAHIYRMRKPWEGDHLSDWLQAEREVLGQLNMELREHEQAFEIHAVIEGFEADDIDVAIHADHVAVRGVLEERTLDEVSEQPWLVHTEFYKVMALPEPVEVESCEATLTGDKLLITLPKTRVG